MSARLLGSIVIEPSAGENAPLFVAALAAALYWRGGRSIRAARRLGTLRPERLRLERWRTLSFVAALVVVVLALQQPIDAYADRLLWMHMVQHVLLLTVVPPLVLLGVPW